MTTSTKLNTGRRKSAIAKVILEEGNGEININGKKLEEYMQNNPKLIKTIQSPIILLGIENKYKARIYAIGGGLSSQADAIKLGISKILYQLSEYDDQRKLRSNGFLTRNSLCKERRSTNCCFDSIKFKFDKLWKFFVKPY